MCRCVKIILYCLIILIPTNYKNIFAGSNYPVNDYAYLTNSDFELFVKVINSESHGESYYDKLCVASVVINRMYSSQFPDNIQKTIYEVNQFSGLNSKYFRFEYDGDNIITANADNESKRAAVQILRYGPIITALYFVNPNKSKQKKWIEYLYENHVLVEENENHVYFL